MCHYFFKHYEVAGTSFFMLRRKVTPLHLILGTVQSKLTALMMNQTSLPINAVLLACLGTSSSIFSQIFNI